MVRILNFSTKYNEFLLKENMRGTIKRMKSLTLHQETLVVLHLLEYSATLKLDSKNLSKSSQNHTIYSNKILTLTDNSLNPNLTLNIKRYNSNIIFLMFFNKFLIKF